MNTAMFAAISSRVTIGKERLGVVSLRGIKRIYLSKRNDVPMSRAPRVGHARQLQAVLWIQTRFRNAPPFEAVHLFLEALQCCPARQRPYSSGRLLRN